MKKTWEQILFFLQGFLILNLLWYAGYLMTDLTVIPDPAAVYKEFPEAMQNGMLIHVLSSLWRIGAGLFLSLMVGVPVGILLAYSKRLHRVFFPFIYFSYPIPKTALLPIAMLLLGMRDSSKILILFLVIVFQVIVSVHDSVTCIDESFYQIMKASGASMYEILIHLTLPAILPSLFTSIRISVGTAVAILFFVESYGTRYGIGYYIIDAWSRIQYRQMYLGIIVIAIVGYFLFVLVDAISRYVCRWQQV